MHTHFTRADELLPQIKAEALSADKAFDAKLAMQKEKNLVQETRAV